MVLVQLALTANTFVGRLLVAESARRQVVVDVHSLLHEERPQAVRIAFSFVARCHDPHRTQDDANRPLGARVGVLVVWHRQRALGGQTRCHLAGVLGYVALVGEVVLNHVARELPIAVPLDDAATHGAEKVCVVSLILLEGRENRLVVLGLEEGNADVRGRPVVENDGCDEAVAHRRGEASDKVA